MSSLREKLTAAQVRELMLSDLERSGLNEKDAKRLGFRPLPADQLKAEYPELTRHCFAGYTIPYTNIAGKQLDFLRFRYLEELPVSAWRGKKKSPRYVQPKGAAPQLYAPRLFDWSAWTKDRLLLTEGEKKAASSCKHGLPTAALGGVWNFRSKKSLLISDIAALPLDGLNVYIVYDSDAKFNNDVIRAENALATQLLARKATVFIVRLPHGNQKVGLDDFLVQNGADPLIDLLTETPEWEPSAALHRMNEEAVFIRKSAEALSIRDGFVYSRSRFFDLMAPLKHAVRNEKEVMVEKSTVKEWWSSSIRNEVRGLVYEPGEPTIISNGTEYPDYNLYQGWGVEPKEGDVTLFFELVDHLLHECTREERSWFLQWLAYPVQHPGTKLASCALIWSTGQGVGKSFLGEIMAKIYGANYKLVEDSELLSEFNTWAKGRQFIVGDEIGAKVRQAADRMKGYITRPTITVNEKFTNPYEIRDCINYLFTSNSPNASFLETDDRRHFVVNCQRPPLSEDFYKRLKKFKNGDGPAAVMHYLLHLDTSDFNPQARPPLTSAKARMIETSRSEAARWCVDLKTDRPKDLGPLASSVQLLPHFVDRKHNSLGPPKLMTIALQSEGFRQAVCGEQIKINKSWGMQRLWVLDSAKTDEWSSPEANKDEIRQAFISHYGKEDLIKKGSK